MKYERFFLAVVVVMAGLLLCACGKAETEKANVTAETEAKVQTAYDVPLELASYVYRLAEEGQYGWFYLDDGEKTFASDVCARFVLESDLSPSYATLEVFDAVDDSKMYANVPITFLSRDDWSFGIPSVSGAGNVTYLKHSYIDGFKDLLYLEGKGDNNGKTVNFMFTLRPWGQRWDDVKEEKPANLPQLYDEWYMDQIREGKAFPYPKQADGAAS